MSVPLLQLLECMVLIAIGAVMGKDAGERSAIARELHTFHLDYRQAVCNVQLTTLL